MTEDEMVGWHHQLIGYDFEQTPGGNILQVFDNYYLTKQRIFAGTSLVVQWLKFSIPNVGGWVQSLVRELDPACHN